MRKLKMSLGLWAWHQSRISFSLYFFKFVLGVWPAFVHYQGHVATILLTVRSCLCNNCSHCSLLVCKHCLTFHPPWCGFWPVNKNKTWVISLSTPRFFSVSESIIKVSLLSWLSPHDRFKRESSLIVNKKKNHSEINSANKL